MYDIQPLSLSTLHRFSAHSYNNFQLLEMEKKLMTVIDYDLFVRDNLLVDRVGLFMESVRCLMDENDYLRFSELCFAITNLLFENVSIFKRKWSSAYRLRYNSSRAPYLDEKRWEIANND